MKKNRFTEEQIIGLLREQEAGTDASDAKKLKALEDENAKLKRLLAESRRRCVNCFTIGYWAKSLPSVVAKKIELLASIDELV